MWSASKTAAFRKVIFETDALHNGAADFGILYLIQEEDGSLSDDVQDTDPVTGGSNDSNVDGWIADQFESVDDGRVEGWITDQKEMIDDRQVNGWISDAFDDNSGISSEICPLIFRNRERKPDVKSEVSKDSFARMRMRRCVKI